MSAISLELFKKHVRADDFDADDALLQHYLDAAEEWVVDCTNRDFGELALDGNGELPKPLVQAILLVAAHWYNQRESVSGAQMAEVPDGLQALIKRYIKLT